MAAVLRFLAGLVVAAAIHALCSRLPGRAGLWIDPFLIFVLYHSLRHGPSSSAVAGSAAGLTHDALSGGLFGLHGFAGTAIAYAAATVRQRFVIQQPTQVAVLCSLAAGCQTLLLALLQASMVSEGELPRPLDALMHMLLTGLLGTAVFDGAERFFAWDRERRERRARRLRLDT